MMSTIHCSYTIATFSGRQAGQYWHTYRSTNVLTAQFNTKHALHLSEDLRVGNSTTRFVVGHDVGLLADTGAQVLLRHTLSLTALADELADAGGNASRGKYLVFAVQLGNVLVIRTNSLVRARIRWLTKYTLLRSFSLTAPTALARSRLVGPWRTPPEGRALRPITTVWSQADMVFQKMDGYGVPQWRSTATTWLNSTTFAAYTSESSVPTHQHSQQGAIEDMSRCLQRCHGCSVTV